MASCWQRFWGGENPQAPHSSSLECEVTPNPFGHGTFWTRLPLLGQDERCWEEHGCESPVSQEINKSLPQSCTHLFSPSSCLYLQFRVFIDQRG